MKFRRGARGLLAGYVRKNARKNAWAGMVAGALLLVSCANPQWDNLSFVIDPLAPNWEIAEASLPNDVYRLTIKAKHLRRGGDGEPMAILKRRAQQLQLEQGAVGYRILDYSENIESSAPFARRYATGSFMLQRSAGIPEENAGTGQNALN